MNDRPPMVFERLVRMNLFPRLLVYFLLLSLLPIVALGLRASLRGRDAIQNVVLQQLEAEARSVAARVRDFLLERERDIRVLAAHEISPRFFRSLSRARHEELWYRRGTGTDWQEVREYLPIYAEMAYVSATGEEVFRLVNEEPVPPGALRHVADPANTTYKCEDYFAQTLAQPPGEMYVSHLFGWYVNQRQQLAGQTSIEDAVPGRQYHGVIRFATRDLAPDGALRGVILLSVDHRHLLEFTQHLVPLSGEPVVFPRYSAGNYAYLFDDEGWFITHPKLWNLRGVDGDGNWVPAYTPETPADLVQGGTIPLNLARMAWHQPWYDDIMPRVRAGGVVRDVAPNVGYRGARPVPRARVYLPIPFDRGPYRKHGIFGGVAIGAEFGVVDELSAGLERDMVLVMLVVGALVVIAAVWLSRSIARPVQQLREAARRVGAGDLESEIRVGGKDEVGDLAHSFNEMVAALRESRRRLREAERFASIGAVISGTAHAIKTELNVYGLLNNVTLLERQVPADDPRRKYVEAVKKGIEDLEATVTRLLVPTPQLEAPCGLNDLVRDALALYEGHARKRGIDVVKEWGAQLPPVRVDRQMVSRALMNLFDNAMDAMPECGTLHVRTGRAADAAGRGRVFVEVSDTGPGIPPDARERIFFPFFTTKREQGGSGLGLYQSLRILSDHGGALDLVDRPEGGTTVRVTLPAEPSEP